MRNTIKYISAAGWFITFFASIILVWLFPLSIAWLWFFIASLLFLFGFYAISAGDEYDNKYEYDYDYEKPIEPKEDEKPYIAKLDTTCKKCGAPMIGDTCDYCGCKSAIYKVIR